MSDDIFTLRVSEFFTEYGIVYKTITVKERQRKYRHIGRILSALHVGGKIASVDPALLTVHDIMHYAAYIRDNMVHNKLTYRARFISLLNVLCKFYSNRCVEDAKARWPSLFPKERKGRRTGNLTRSEYNTVIQYINRPDQGWYELRASFAVAVSLCSGIRPQEDQHLRDSNLDVERMLCNLVHVKGRSTFADPRTSPMHTDGRDIMLRYLAAYEERGMSGYFFQNVTNNRGHPLSQKTVAKMFREVSAGCGVRLTATKCRATWIVMQLNTSKNIEAVSVAAGHGDSRTTAIYGRMSNEVAVETIQESWEKEKEENDRKSKEGEASNDFLDEIMRAGRDSNPGQRLRKPPCYPSYTTGPYSY